MSLCSEHPRQIGSYVLVDSAKIQAHVPGFLAWCEADFARVREAHVRKVVDDYNRDAAKRPWWRLWRTRPPITAARAVHLLDRLSASDSIFDSSTWLEHIDYMSDRRSDAQAAARRLLAMSHVEPRVLVSAHDFDLVFRAGNARPADAAPFAADAPE